MMASAKGFDPLSSKVETFGWEMKLLITLHFPSRTPARVFYTNAGWKVKFINPVFKKCSLQKQRNY